MTTARSESNERERALAWELIEEIGRCDEQNAEGALPNVVAAAFARYRDELERQRAEALAKQP